MLLASVFSLKSNFTVKNCISNTSSGSSFTIIPGKEGTLWLNSINYIRIWMWSLYDIQCHSLLPWCKGRNVKNKFVRRLQLCNFHSTTLTNFDLPKTTQLTPLPSKEIPSCQWSSNSAPLISQFFPLLISVCSLPKPNIGWQRKIVALTPIPIHSTSKQWCNSIPWNVKILSPKYGQLSMLFICFITRCAAIF